MQNSVIDNWRGADYLARSPEPAGGLELAVDLARAAAVRAEFRWADGMSEDLWFSRQLRLAGERVYVDPRVATVHLGQPEILTYAPA